MSIWLHVRLNIRNAIEVVVIKMHKGDILSLLKEYNNHVALTCFLFISFLILFAWCFFDGGTGKAEPFRFGSNAGTHTTRRVQMTGIRNKMFSQSRCIREVVRVQNPPRRLQHRYRLTPKLFKSSTWRKLAIRRHAIVANWRAFTSTEIVRLHKIHYTNLRSTGRRNPEEFLSKLQQERVQRNPKQDTRKRGALDVVTISNADTIVL